MPIEMPTMPGFTTCRFGLETNTQRFESPLTKAVQRVRLGGSRWVATYSLPAMRRDKAAAWIAFFLRLEGSSNTFYGFDPDCRTPRGAATGTPVVNGGSQLGTSLVISGCTPNVTGWLLPGDYFSVNGELKLATGRVDTDGSGNATIQFMPPLRNSPPDGVPILVDRPSCAMILVDDMQAMWECDVNGVYQPKTFSAMEVFS